MYKLKGGLPYNTDCFSYWQGTIQASYAVMRQLLLDFKCVYYRLKSMVGLLLHSSFLQLPVAEQVDLSTTTISELVKMNYPSCVAKKSALSPGSNKLSSK